MSGRVVSVNVGSARTAAWEGRTVRSAIWKEPAAGPVAVRGESLAGDVQADRSRHGGERKAVYAYAQEDVRWWEGVLGRALGPGAFGENLTLEGVDLCAARVGERWRIGTALLEITQPRMPCFKLGMRHGDPTLPDRFRAAGRAGAYLRVVEEGVVAAGDAAVLERPAGPEGLALAEVFRARTTASERGPAG